MQNPVRRIRHVTNHGVSLDAEPLNRASMTDDLVLIFEGRSNTEKPLVLEIIHPLNQAVIVSAEMPMRLSSTMEMMRWSQIQWDGFSGDGVSLNDPKVPDNQSVSEPPNWPDNETNEQLIVFVHGFNEDNVSAAGHASTMFKRLYWSGSCAGFAAVRWPANLLHGGGSGGVFAAPNFQLDVHSALANAHKLKNILNDYSNGGWKQIHLITHSLGSMICNEALRQGAGNLVDNYVMLNAAVPTEALADLPPKVNNQENYSDIDQKMVHGEWRSYHARVFMSEWWRLFDESDARRDLTWRGRHLCVIGKTRVFNIYSPSEDILALRDEVSGWGTWAVGNVWRARFGREDIGTGSWQAQEAFKGRNVHIGGLSSIWSKMRFTFDYGGWAFSGRKRNHIFSLYRNERRAIDWTWTHIETAADYFDWERFLLSYAEQTATTEELQTEPFFRKQGRRSPAGISALYGGTTPAAKEAAAAFVEANLPELLARMVPAITGPAGSRPVPLLDELRALSGYTGGNFNFESHRSTPWPRPIWPSPRDGWLHRDHRRAAYVYVSSLFRFLAGDQALNVQWNAEHE